MLPISSAGSQSGTKTQASRPLYRTPCPGDKAYFCNLKVQGGLFRPGNGFYYLSEAGAVSSLSVRLCPRKKSEKNADQKSM